MEVATIGILGNKDNRDRIPLELTREASCRNILMIQRSDIYFVTICLSLSFTLPLLGKAFDCPKLYSSARVYSVTAVLEYSDY